MEASIYKLNCEVCGYKGKTVSKQKAYYTMYAHKQGWHDIRANFFKLSKEKPNDLSELFFKILEKRMTEDNIISRVKGTTDKGMGFAGIAIAERFNKIIKKNQEIQKINNLKR